MVVRTITITDAAYRRLKRLKRPGESFSDVIHRVAQERSARAFIGILSPEAGDSLAEVVAEARRQLDEEMERRTRKWAP